MKMKIDDIELYYESHGKGKPIVFSHAFLDDSSIWNSQVRHFSKNHTVILYDHRDMAGLISRKEGKEIILCKYCQMTCIPSYKN